MSASGPVVAIQLPSLLRTAAGCDQIKVRATTLRGALDELVRQHPKLSPHLFDERGRLRDHINLFVGDRLCKWDEAAQTRLEPRTAITVLQAVSGG